MILHAINWISERALLAIAASIFLGLAFPGLAALARPLLPVAVFGLLVIAMTRTDALAARGYMRNPRLVLAGVAWAMIALPLLTAAACHLLAPPAPIALGLMLLATAPSTVSVPAVAPVLRLDGTFALALLIAGFVLTPVSVPALTEFALDAELGISSLELAFRLFGLLAGSGAAALVLRRLLGERRRQAAEPAFDVANVLMLALFAVSAMDGVTDALLADTWHTLGLIAFAFALSLGQLAVTAALFWRAAGAGHAVTIGLAAGSRNMALAVSALAGSMHPDTWLFFAVVQFPIYIVPMLARPFTRRLLRARARREAPSPRP